MERGRRSQQSDDRRGTSLLIQQLAAARERKLQGTSSFRSRAVDPLKDCETEARSSEVSASDGSEELGSPTASAPTDPHRGALPLPHNRLVRRDKQQSSASAATSTDAVGDLSEMLQGMGLAATGRAENQQQQGQYRFPSSRLDDRSSSNTSFKHLGGIAQTGSSRGPQQHALDVSHQLNISSTASAVDFNSRHVAASAPAAAASNSSTDEEDDDSCMTQVQRSSTSAAATGRSRAYAGGSSSNSFNRRQTNNSTHPQQPSTVVSSSEDDDGADSDVDADVALSNARSLVAGPRSSNASTSSTTSSTRPSSNGIRPYLNKQQPAAPVEPAEGSLLLEGGFCLEGMIASKLYPHQVQGVTWLWSLHRMRKGGILADDMGLGKTMQCAAFLAGSLRSNNAIRALVVAPKTLLAHWEKELRVCGMAARTHSFYGSSDGERAAALRTITGRGGVMLTTYGMVLHNAQQLRAGLGPVARDSDEHEDEIDLLCPDPPPGRRILWDYIILDEGHKIKNSRTQLAQRLRELRGTSRVIISGTPVQNNLSELHSLLDFAVPGLLGGAKEFKMVYEKAITAGQDRDATLRVRELGAAKAAELRKIVAPYMLRREKKEVLGGGSGSKEDAETARSSSTAGGSSSAVVAAAATTSNSSSSSSKSAPAPAPMGSKHDLVVWLRLQPLQRHIYEAFLHSDAVKAALNSTKSPLAALTVLKKICDHPALLSERATNLVMSAASKPLRKPTKSSSKQQRRNSMDDFIVDDDESDATSHSGSDDYESDSDSDSDSSPGSRYYQHPGRGANNKHGKAARSRAAVAAGLDDAGFSDEFISWAESEGLESRLLSDIGRRGTEASCKSLFVTALLEELVSAGHRTLVFSQSRVMLDILQAAVTAHGWSFCRIDGTMASTDARQAEVDKFQAAGAKIPVFLLTTQVGGLGLTLTAANRVVVVDPSWNPATDNQSVDRAYRIGQSRDVVVYRLVTCGTVEEKIYRKQVFKGGLSKAGMEEGVQLRYFTHQELHELFNWDPEALTTSETQQLLAQQHSQHTRKTLDENPNLAQHVSWIQGLSLCAGTSEHGLLFSELDPDAKTLQLQRPEYQSNNVTSNMTDRGLAERRSRGGGGLGSRPGRRGLGAGAGAYTAAAAGPSAAEISTMLASLNIAPTNGSSSSSVGGGGRYEQQPSMTGMSAAAAAAGQNQSRNAAYASAAAAAAAARHAAESRIKELECSLLKVTADISMLGGRLADGGAKLMARQAELQSSLQAAQENLQKLITQKPPAAAIGGTAAAAAGDSKDAALVDITNGAPAAAAAGQRGSGIDQWQQHQQQREKHIRPPPPPPRPQQQQLGQQLLLQQRVMPPSLQLQQQQQQQGFRLSDQQQPQQQQQQQQRVLPGSLQDQQQTSQRGYGGYGQVPPPPPPRQQQQQQQQLGCAVLAQQRQNHSGSRSTAADAAPNAAAGATGPAHPSNSSSSSASRIRPSGQPPQCAREPTPTPPAAAEVLPNGVQAVTLDGRVPTLSQLLQRKHVLKTALQKEDQIREGLKAQGQQYPQRQQWMAMYEEYKEIKRLLGQAAGTRGSALGAKPPVETIDLT